MVKISIPVKCPICGKDMITYTINKNTGKFLFVCDKPNHTKELTEQEYIEEIGSNR